MASGTPVVLSGDAALREVAGDAASYAEDGDYGRALGAVLADRGRFAQAGLERARRYTWEATARRTADGLPERARMKVAAVVVSHGTPDAARALAAGTADPGRRARRDREHPGLRSGRRRAPSTTRSRSATPPNLNNGFAVDDGAARRLGRTPTPRPSPARSRRSRRSWRAIRRCGVAGPAHDLPDGTLATVAATLSDRRRARSSAARRFGSSSRNGGTSISTRPCRRSRSRRTGCSAAS